MENRVWKWNLDSDSATQKKELEKKLKADSRLCVSFQEPNDWARVPNLPLGTPLNSWVLVITIQAIGIDPGPVIKEIGLLICKYFPRASQINQI